MRCYSDCWPQITIVSECRSHHW